MKIRKRAVMLILAAAGMFLVQPVHARDNDLVYKLKPGSKGKLCLGCHPTFQDTMARPFVHTPLKNGECNGCHNPHTSNHGKMLAADVKLVCLTCHDTVIPAKAASTHKVVADGECMKCHDPHAAANKFNLLGAGNQLCFACHKEMGEAAGKMKFKHSPVAKSCLTCHDPHASGKFPYLLKNDINGLCIGCHKTDKPLFVKKHMNYPVASARCTGCHDPHGSNMPGILYNNVHKPIANKMCNQCHEEATSANPLKTKKSGSELCRGCHNDMVNVTFGKNRVHAPLIGKEGCLSCHNPHAGKQKGILKDSMQNLCGSCHQDTMKRQGKLMSKHEPVAGGRCTDCHNPHASDNVFLTVKPADFDMCSASCHDWGKHSTHPIGEKFKDPRNKSTSLSCLSCHKSHGTEYKKMLTAPTTTELCTQCHDNFKR
ncbi:cytochrome c3 family protein [Geobacter sp. DSM 9736]|uniref:cytochrome c3 family protein n=1 Tax=Geobacter sp. DSM 9736 TaxID=1277350 RepID=UPI000B4FE77A|nr:cytochrome c3 family protein [Geobacter sp. DSM 9736]SNB47138.1 doubled CXXCH domain-containing protein [Geobacter sp. DSM 9736]